MKTTILGVALVAALAGGSSAVADDAGASAGAAPGADVFSSASGAETYSRICQGCHMPQAQGAVGAGRYPALAGDRALVSWEYVAITVLLGRHAMPAFGKPADPTFVFGEVHISDAQIADVVNYVRSHFGNTYRDKVTAAQVAALPHPIN